MAYHLHSCPSAPPLGIDWSDPAWQGAETAQVGHFLPESSAHRPRALVRVLYGHDGLHGIFQVHDRYVRCVRTEYFEPVYKDSCVEFFVQPKPGSGYFNFEFNCGGAYLCNYITDSTLVNGNWKASVPVPAALGRKVRVQGSLPRIVEPEIRRPVSWTLQFFIPFCLFEEYVGALGSLPGQVWRGNFFKCASEVSHPHWAAWSPVDEFNFHLPRCFGWLFFNPYPLHP